MPARIAVVHASQPAALAGVARAIAEVLGRAGAAVEVLPAREVASLSGFDAVVAAGRLERDGWRDEAVLFIARHRRHLSHLTVAYALALPDDMDPARDPRGLQRALAYVLDWYNEIRPVKLGLFHLNRPDALAQVRAWAELLKPNFLDLQQESPAGLRPFLEAHPLYERMDPSRLPPVRTTRAERDVLRGPPRGEMP